MRNPLAPEDVGWMELWRQSDKRLAGRTRPRSQRDWKIFALGRADAVATIQKTFGQGVSVKEGLRRFRTGGDSPAAEAGAPPPLPGQGQPPRVPTPKPEVKPAPAPAQAPSFSTSAPAPALAAPPVSEAIPATASFVQNPRRFANWRETLLPGRDKVPANAQYRYKKAKDHLVLIAFWGKGKSRRSKAVAILHPKGEHNPEKASLCPVCHNPVAVPEGQFQVNCVQCGSKLGVRRG